MAAPVERARSDGGFLRWGPEEDAVSDVFVFGQFRYIGEIDGGWLPGLPITTESSLQTFVSHAVSKACRHAQNIHQRRRLLRKLQMHRILGQIVVEIGLILELQDEPMCHSFAERLPAAILALKGFSQTIVLAFPRRRRLDIGQNKTHHAPAFILFM